MCLTSSVLDLLSVLCWTGALQPMHRAASPHARITATELPKTAFLLEVQAAGNGLPRRCCCVQRASMTGSATKAAAALPGVTRVVTREQGIFKYFLKVVPTTFKRGYGRVVQSNQISVTEYDAAQPQAGMQMPAVWFLYDLSPISVDIVESHPSLLHFLTRLCAVVGGGFTVTGALPCWPACCGCCAQYRDCLLGWRH